MTKEEYLMKCKSVVNVINRILSGDYVSPEERVNAYKDVIEIIGHENIQNEKSKNGK